MQSFGGGKKSKGEGRSDFKLMQTVAFLISDSRSGSTLLARELSARVPNLLVTPELNLDDVFKYRVGGVKYSSRRVLRHVGAQPNFGRPGPDLPAEFVAPNPEFPTSIRRHEFEYLISTWFRDRYAGPPPRCIVIKNGSHARYWRQIRDALGESARFIFLVRDPRAVVCSKLRTPRPYKPVEVMAWGGPLIAALKWRSIVRHMNRAAASGAPVIRIRYVDLVSNVDETIESIACFCKCNGPSRNEHSAFAVPEAERGIHQAAINEPITDNRVNLWRSELSSQDRRVIEAICRREMVAQGYDISDRRSRLDEWYAILCAIPSAAWKVGVHFCRDCATYLSTRMHNFSDG